MVELPMKRKVVELDIKSPGPDRALGDAPGLGRLSKAGTSAKSDELRLDDTAPMEEDDEEDDGSRPGEWLIRMGMVSALLIGLIAGVGLIYFTAVSKLGTGQPPRSVEDPDAPVPAVKEVVEEDGMLSSHEALDLVRRGLAVRFASKVTDHFRYTEDLDPPAVVAFLKDYTARDGLVTRMECLEPIEEDGVVIVRVRVYSTLSGEPHIRDACLVQDAKGEWKIDFDSFVSQQYRYDELQKVEVLEQVEGEEQ